MAAAAAVSIDRILAWASGLGSTAMCNNPGGASSMVYSSVPVTTRTPAGAPIDRPTS